MTVRIETARCVEVTLISAGSQLAAAATAGDAVLSLVSVDDFSDTGGEFTYLDPADDATEVVVGYASKDDDAETLTLTGTLPDTIDADTFLAVHPASREKRALVKFEEADTASPARLSHTVRDFLAEGVREPDEQEAVVVTIDASGAATVTDLLGEGVVALDADAVATPYLVGWPFTAGPTIPHATETTLTGWIALGPGEWEPEASGVFTIPKDGRYLVTFGVRWQLNSNGRRQCFMRYTRATAGPVAIIEPAGTANGWRDSRNAEPTDAMSTLAVQTVGLRAGDTVEFVVFQSSGAGLALSSGNLDDNMFSLSWIGSL